MLIIFILATIASYYGIFSENISNKREFQAISGQTVKLYAKGLYKNDSVSGGSQAVGQDIVTLIIGLPLLLISLFIYRKNLLKGKLLLAGTLNYFLYTYTSYSFLVMYNSFFLIYVMLTSLSFYAFTLIMMSFNLETISSCFSKKLPVKLIGGLLIFMSIAVGMMWLGIILPALKQGIFLKGNYHMMIENIFAVDLSILKIFTWGVNYAFFALMLTSFIYGLFTEWGFVKHRWIIFKWIVVLIMFAVTWFGLGPALNGMTSIADAGLNNSTLSRDYMNFQQKAIVFTIIEGIAIVLIILISVLKPWGVRNIKRQVKQKTVVMILLPIIVICIGFVAINAMTLNKIRNIHIENIDLTKVNDGIYQGETKAGNYIYKVKVKVDNHKIVNINGVDNRKSPYVTYAEGVFIKIVKQQKLDVDAVTGATTTSKAFMKAAENALGK